MFIPQENWLFSNPLALYKRDLLISTTGKHVGIIKFINIFHIMDRIKVLRVSLCIVHCHICMELKFTWNYTYSHLFLCMTIIIMNIIYLGNMQSKFFPECTSSTFDWGFDIHSNYDSTTLTFWSLNIALTFWCLNIALTFMMSKYNFNSLMSKYNFNILMSKYNFNIHDV